MQPASEKAQSMAHSTPRTRRPRRVVTQSPKWLSLESRQPLKTFNARYAGRAISLRRLFMAEPLFQRLEQLLGRFRDHRAGREDRLGAGLVERVVILRRHHAADHDHDVVAALACELL